MPYIAIRYGPYMCCGIIDHRVQKINGLFNALDRLNYEIEVVPINEYNRLSIEMFDREVFRCDIRNLMFNMPVEEDPICQRAVWAVEEARQRMSTDEHLSCPNRKDIGYSLPSNADLMFEIRFESQQQLQIGESRDVDTSKNEGNHNKMKIMEDKSTTFQ